MRRSIETRSKILSAALGLVRVKSFSTTTVDELAALASVTKGAFFHRFAGNKALAVATARHCSERSGALFRSEASRTLRDPLERVLGYLDFRKSTPMRKARDSSCVVGTMVQELYDTSPSIRDACRRPVSKQRRTTP